MTLTDAVSPFWRSLARTLSSQLHDCYNWEEEGDSSSSTTSFSKRWLRRSASAAIPVRIAVVDEQKRFTLTTMCERRMVESQTPWMDPLTSTTAKAHPCWLKTWLL